MSQRICSIDGCERPVSGRGWCGGHYARWRTHGDVQADVPIKDQSAPRGICPIEGCEREVRSGGLCSRHYQNLYNYGHAVPLKERPLLERLRRVGWTVAQSGCWEWNGRRNDFGYGLYNHRRAHRLMYEFTIGPIPDGLIVRHDCDNPPCVNPSHLQVGTHQDNSNDAVERGRMLRDSCKRGHDMNAPGGRNGQSECTICSRDRRTRWARKKRAQSKETEDGHRESA